MGGIKQNLENLGGGKTKPWGGYFPHWGGLDKSLPSCPARPDSARLSPTRPARPCSARPGRPYSARVDPARRLGNNLLECRKGSIRDRLLYPAASTRPGQTLHCHHRAWYDVVIYTQAWLNSKMTWLRENNVEWMSDSWLIPRRCSNHVVCVRDHALPITVWLNPHLRR